MSFSLYLNEFEFSQQLLCFSFAQSLDQKGMDFKTNNSSSRCIQPKSIVTKIVRIFDEVRNTAHVCTLSAFSCAHPPPPHPLRPRARLLVGKHVCMLLCACTCMCVCARERFGRL